MADNVETMFYAGQTPWHGLGVGVEKEITAEEAIVKAGLDWTVSTKPLLTEGGQTVRDSRAIVRDSDGACLGVVGKLYSPIQNRTGFNLMDAVVGAGQAVYHTAGSLDGGRKVWILVKLPGEIVLGKGDVTEKYMLLSLPHDGSGCLQLMNTPIRVVCQNTLNLALSLGGAENTVRIRHFSNANQRIEAASLAMKKATEWYDQFGTVAARMAAVRYKKGQLKELSEELFPSSAEVVEGEDAPKIHPFTLKNRERVVDLFDSGAGHAAIKGTAWAALNAVAEFADHERAPRALQEKRVESTWFGPAADLKTRAFQIIQRQIG